jgi:hypothetical protein
MADAALAGSAPVQPKLDDLMLAMDVVDTLRHDQTVVERELAADDSDEALIERLRGLYRAQGIEVTDRVLVEGVKALREKRFSYDPAPPGLARSLALAWINRGKFLWGLFGLAGALAVAWFGYQLLVVRPQQVAAEQADRQINEIIPKALANDYGDIVRETKVDSARERADQLMSDAKAALARGDVNGANKAAADLQALLKELRSEFTVRIINRPGLASGVWREPAINTRARNYYLIVEAVAPSGQILTRPITSEETGQTTVADKWGIRVSHDLFEQVAADKREDGIIQRNIVGQKKRGYTDIDYSVPLQGGLITKW